MTYNNLYSDFKAMFPEYADTLDKLALGADADESDGMHIMFSFVVIPFVLELLNKDDTPNLSKAFAYFEKMAVSDSADITEVLEFTVIENLMSNGYHVYNKAKTHMGQTMLECCKTAEDYLKVGE